MKLFAYHLLVKDLYINSSYNPSFLRFVYWFFQILGTLLVIECEKTATVTQKSNYTRIIIFSKNAALRYLSLIKYGIIFLFFTLNFSSKA